jgi:hypothetical protein
MNIPINNFLPILSLFLLGIISNAQKIPTISIGKQEWQVKNLEVTKFRNGDAIPEAQSDADWK